MMILADGDVNQYREMWRMSIVDYITKLNTFVERHESMVRDRMRFTKPKKALP